MNGCVPLPPEGIERFNLAVVTSRDQPCVSLIDLSGGIAQEGQRHSSAASGWRLPVRKALYDCFGVEHEANTTVDHGLDVTFPFWLTELNAKRTVERERLVHVTDDETEGIQTHVLSLRAAEARQLGPPRNQCKDAPVTAAEEKQRSPVAELLADRNFRRYWIAQVLVFGTNGTLRFVFVWLVVTLTAWPSAEGLLGIALGLPALLLALPAGAWSDRFDRRRMIVFWVAVSAALLFVWTIVVAVDAATPRRTGIAAVLLGTSLVMMQPNLNAIVPKLVPRERLLNAAALQNGGSQAANFLGLGVAGGAIAIFGNEGGFALLTIVMVVGAILLWGVVIPPDEERTGPPQRLRTDVLEGLRYGLGSEPRRSLLIATLVLGSSFSVMQIAMPRVVEEDFGKGSLAAGLLLGTFGVGMLASSAVVARRKDMRHGLNVGLFIGIGLGMGQFLLSLAPNYWVAVVVMIAWGINAGIAIASHRTLLQQRTEEAMMGRVMGIMTLGFSGGLPFGALTQTVLAPALGPVLTMRTVGLATMAITIPLLLLRPSVRNA